MTDERRGMFIAAHRIHQISDEEFRRTPRAQIGFYFTLTGPNIDPTRGQMEAGILIRMHNGHPHELLTPWGLIILVNAVRAPEGILPQLTERIFGRIQTTPYQNGGTDSGPLYEVISVEGVTLPSAVLRNEQSYRDARIVRAEWDELMSHYDPKGD